ncbi:MAG: UvrD-helicase domain-containing protein [Patescibacteria group bacterium]|nr:UvrD-helicase domain-containing protein [Patescibacteria group bacterium]
MNKPICQDLNPEQRKAVTVTDGPILIVAGAGTGKTMVITRKISHLITEGFARPEEILALTFTDKAAGEMEERVDKLLPYGYLDLWISTFHSFAERVLKNHALEIGLPNSFRLLSQVDSWLLVRRNLDKFDLDYWQPRGNPTKFIRAMIEHFSRAKDEDLWPESYLEYAESLKLNKDSDQAADQEVKRVNELANAYHVYQKLLLDNDALDFGDLINYTLKLFRERPHILEQYRAQFKYILVDEFQDTNWAQYELIKLLAAPRNNLTVVGDDDQSIYKFRGASLSNILQFKKDFPESKEVVLVKNYRTRQNILDLAYEFIQRNNPNRLEAQLKNKNLKKKINKKLDAQCPGEGRAEHLHYKTLEQEVRGVAQTIAELKAGDSGLTWDDFAVLVRSNDAAAPFCNYFAKQEIPHQFLALKGLYTRPVVRDILSFFKLLDNYHESPALYRVMSLPVWKISQADLIEMAMEAKRSSSSLWEVVKRHQGLKNLSAGAQESLPRLITLVEGAAALTRDKSTGMVFKYFLEQSGFLHWLDHLPELEKNQKIGWLEQFWEKIKKFETDNVESRLSDFMAQIEFELEAGEEGSLRFEAEEGPEMVRIMTIHGAKGLEFKYVFIVNMVDRRFPTTERSEAIPVPDPLVKEILPAGQDTHLEEERRLFYVAITRAKDGVFFTSADDYGGIRKKKISQFLFELGYSADARAGAGRQSKLSIEVPVPAPKHEKKIEYPFPQKFSFTRLAAFRTCPLQYKYAHILNIPVFGKAVFSFGKSMHAALERFFREWLAQGSQSTLFGKTSVKKGSPGLPPLEKLLEIYGQEWIPAWYENRDEMRGNKETGRRVLKKYWEELAKDPPKTIAVEQTFNVKFGDYTLFGKIDRVDELANGNLALVDYKTGKAKDELKAEDKEQLIIYQIAMEEPRLFNRKVEKLVYYYLESGNRQEFVASEKDKERVTAALIERIEKIKNSDFPPAPSELCRHCDFNFICDYRKI